MNEGSFRFEDRDVMFGPEDAVLDALLNAGERVAYSCKEGACMSCILRCITGEPPLEAFEGLSRRMVGDGAFKACMCPASCVVQVARMGR